METATLRVDRWEAVLRIDGVSINEPKPTRHTVSGCPFNYKDHVGVWSCSHKGYEITVIRTMPGTGRGQASGFDELVGSRIARLRIEARRELRNHRFDDFVHTELLVSPEEIEEIRGRVEAYSTSTTPTFFMGYPGGYALVDGNGNYSGYVG